MVAKVGQADRGREALPGARKRELILVVGMHRSGTSAITRVLNLLGAAIPGELLEPLPDNNPTGFWESLEILLLHDEFLASIGSTWDDPKPLPALDRLKIEPFAERLASFLDSAMDRGGLYVVKDPRLCRLMPLWGLALDRLEIEPFVLLWHRNPLEVAASLERRDGFSRSKSLLIWLRHVLEAERSTRSLRRTIASYDELLEDWEVTMVRIAGDLGLTWPRDFSQVRPAAGEFLSPSRRHHSERAETLTSDPGISGWVSAVYEALFPREKGALPVSAFDRIGSELAEADKAFVPVLVSLEQDRSRLSHELESVQGQCSDLEADLEAVRERQSGLEAALRASHDELAGLGQTLELARIDLEQARAESVAAAVREEEARRELQGQRESWKSERAVLTEEVGRSRELLRGVLESRSWRLTKPLRDVRAWFGRSDRAGGDSAQ